MESIINNKQIKQIVKPVQHGKTKQQKKLTKKMVPIAEVSKFK